jgi:hypothetical protein
MLLQQALVKMIQASLKNMQDEAIQIVNNIKSRPFNIRLFKNLCEELESEHCSSVPTPRGCRAQGKSVYMGPLTFYTGVIQSTVSNESPSRVCMQLLYTVTQHNVLN